MSKDTVTMRLINVWLNAEKKSALSKFLNSEAFCEVTHKTVTILGGRGLTDVYPAEWVFRKARLSMIPTWTN